MIIRNNDEGFIESAKDVITGLKDSVVDVKDAVINLKEGTQDAIATIATLSEMIIEGISWVKVIFTPKFILNFIDKMSIVVILSLIILKMIGFEDLEKWIILSILLKVIAVVCM